MENLSNQLQRDFVQLYPQHGAQVINENQSIKFFTEKVLSIYKWEMLI